MNMCDAPNLALEKEKGLVYSCLDFYLKRIE